MLDAKQLIAIARQLVGKKRKGAPNQTSLRRAISTAYYALFHAMLRAGADVLVGKTKRKTRRYELIYRAFEHAKMLRGCEDVDKPILGAKTQKALGVPSVSQDIRDIASTFVALQQHRHWADYSPQGKIARAEAEDLVDQAELAMSKLNECDASELSDFLVFLLVSSRA